jgi:hypothetical protein
MNEIKKKENNTTLIEILLDVLAKAEEGVTKDKNPPVKLVSKDVAALKKIEKHISLTNDQFKDLAELLLKHDPNMRFMQQVANAVAHHTKAGMSAALIEDCARLFSAWVTNIELAQKRSIFLSIFEDVGENKSVSRFVDLLDNQIKMRLKNLNEIDSDDNLAAASNRLDEKQLLVNARSIGLTWLILKGLVDIDKVIDYLIELNSHDIEVTSIELTKLGLFVVESALPKRDHKVFSLVKLLKVRQAKLQTSLNLETSQRGQLEKELNIEQKKNADQRNENTALHEKVSALEASFAQLNQTLDQQQALGKAERVHLKDDHGKAKYKTLNTLEEDVIPLLEKTGHALNKDVPKVHIATHQLELITEEIEGLIKWLKK